MRRQDLHEYQNYCVEFLKTHPEAMLILQMGLGKSAVSLTAIDLPDSGRRLPKEELIKAAEEVLSELSVSGIRLGVAGSLKKALAETENASERDVYLVCGSLSLMQLF